MTPGLTPPSSPSPASRPGKQYPACGFQLLGRFRFPSSASAIHASLVSRGEPPAFSLENTPTTFFEQHYPSLLSSTRYQWPVIAIGQRKKSDMQLDLSSARSHLPELHPLFLGGATPRCCMATPVTGPSFGKSVEMTGSSSAPLPPRQLDHHCPHHSSFHPAALGRRSRPQSPPCWIPVPYHLGRELYIQGL